MVETTEKYGFDLKTSILMANYLFSSRYGGGSAFLPPRHDIRYLSSGSNLVFDSLLFQES